MGLTSTSALLRVSPAFDLTGGTLSPSLNQSPTVLTADRLFIATRTATTSGDSLDLNAGPLQQPDNSAFSVVSITSLQVINKDTAATLTGGGGTNAVAGLTFTLPPGGQIALVFPTPLAITAGTADILKLTGSASLSYDIMITGRSA